MRISSGLLLICAIALWFNAGYVEYNDGDLDWVQIIIGFMLIYIGMILDSMPKEG